MGGERGSGRREREGGEGERECEERERGSGRREREGGSEGRRERREAVKVGGRVR